jgi:hypothetical protein
MLLQQTSVQKSSGFVTVLLQILIQLFVCCNNSFEIWIQLVTSVLHLMAKHCVCNLP